MGGRGRDGVHSKIGEEEQVVKHSVLGQLEEVRGQRSMGTCERLVMASRVPTCGHHIVVNIGGR